MATTQTNGVSFSSVAPGTLCVVTYTNGWYRKNTYTALTLNINSSGAYPIWVKVTGGSSGYLRFGINQQATMTGNPGNPEYGLHMWFDDMWIITGYDYVWEYTDND